LTSCQHTERRIRTVTEIANDLANALDILGAEGVLGAEAIVRESLRQKFYAMLEADERGEPWPPADPEPGSPRLQRAYAVLEAATKGTNIDHAAILADLKRRLGVAPEGVDQTEWERLQERAEEIAVEAEPLLELTGG